MLKINSLTMLLLSITFLATAQTDDKKATYAGVSYFSEDGFYPGFTVNYEKFLIGNQHFEMLAAAKAGAYFHYRNHTGIFVMIQSGQRYRLFSHFYFEHFFGIGYLHSFLSGGSAYYVDATGAVHKATNWGNAHFMPSISAGLSYHAEGKKDFWVFARPMFFWQIPFNHASLLQVGVEVGANVKIK
jgi:hypothetical protein